MQVLVLNCGSSSVKFAVIDVVTGGRRAHGLAEKVGTVEASLRIVVGEDDERLTPTDTTHHGVVSLLLDRLSVAGIRPVAVGHRVVHGGHRFSSSALIDDGVLEGIEACTDLAPLHNPPSIDGIRAAKSVLPDVPHVAVFDTAFHQTMPPKAYRYAIPEEWYSEHAVRRYGFHGTSYRYVSDKAVQILGIDPGDSRLVIAHLGNGASVTAIRGGESVDTSMGLTPLEGLVMGTRSGDVDPGLHSYIADRTGASVGEVTRLLNQGSGLLGLSAVSNDMRTVVEAASGGSAGAGLALDVFCYRLAKYVASYLVPLERIDAVVFTGGIGENSAIIREKVVQELLCLDLHIDPVANGEHGRVTGGRISTGGATRALVVATDEELLIARDAAALSGSP